MITGPYNVSIGVTPKVELCKTEGRAVIILECFVTRCIDTGSNQVVSKSEAGSMVMIAVNRTEPGAPEIKPPRPSKWKTLGWENNMFYQWMKYSAKQMSDQACMTCYNSRRKPIIKPFPGFGDGRCDQASTSCGMYTEIGCRDTGRTDK